MKQINGDLKGLSSKLQKEYEEELKSIPDFALDLPINNHLKSFDEYMVWRKKVNSLFTSDDNAKNLL